MSLLQLYPYQKRLIEDQKRFICCLQARQTGKSFAAAAKIVLECRARPYTKWFVISSGERQVKDFMEKIKIHTQITGEVVDWFEQSCQYTRSDGEEDEYKILSILFRNNSRVIALPANPDTVRGYTGNVYFDEFSTQKNSKEMWAAVFPIISRGKFKMLITFTPKGKLNMAYEVWKNEIFSHHRTDIYEAVNQGCPHDIELLKMAIDDPELWMQEYELAFLDETTAYIPYDLIMSAQNEKAGIPCEKFEKKIFYVGQDIGRRKHLAVFWVLEKVEDVYWSREVIELPKAKFSEQDAELDRIINTYNPVKVCMDQTGMGEKPVEDAINKYGEHRIEGIQFTIAAKISIAGQVRKNFEDKTLRIPDTRKIRDDIHSVKRIATAGGNFRFDAADTKIGHADRFWALALAIHASEGLKAAVSIGSDTLKYYEKQMVEEEKEIHYRPNNRPGYGVLKTRFRKEKDIYVRN